MLWIRSHTKYAVNNGQLSSNRPEGSDPLTKFFHAIANQEKPQKNWVGQPRTISKKCVGAPGDV